MCNDVDRDIYLSVASSDSSIMRSPDTDRRPVASRRLYLYPGPVYLHLLYFIQPSHFTSLPGASDCAPGSPPPSLQQAVLGEEEEEKKRKNNPLKMRLNILWLFSLCLGFFLPWCWPYPTKSYPRRDGWARNINRFHGSL